MTLFNIFLHLIQEGTDLTYVDNASHSPPLHMNKCLRGRPLRDGEIFSVDCGRMSILVSSSNRLIEHTSDDYDRFGLFWAQFYYAYLLDQIVHGRFYSGPLMVVSSSCILICFAFFLRILDFQSLEDSFHDLVSFVV